jgi:hypothetical protein
MSMVSIIGSEKGFFARKLAKELGIDYNVPREVQIRWGHYGGEVGRKELNNKDALMKCSNKYDAMVLMSNANVPVVPFSLHPEDLMYPIFGRMYHHLQGRDVKVIRNVLDLRMPLSKYMSDFYTAYMTPLHEYRVHVINNVCVAFRRKDEKKDEEGHILVTDYYIRNHRFGWAQNTCKDRHGIGEIALKAVKALSLDFGAVDIVVRKEDSKPYVLEVNTSPGLNGEKTFNAYKDAFKAWIDLRVRTLVTGSEI